MPDQDLGPFMSLSGINPPGGVVGAILASSATITLTHPIHHVSGTESITTIVPPYTGFVGSIRLIADGAFTMTTGGTSPNAIATVVTSVAAQVLMMTSDGASWYPHIMD